MADLVALMKILRKIASYAVFVPMKSSILKVPMLVMVKSNIR